MTKSFIGEKEKWTNKGNDKSSMLFLFYKIQQVIPNICTKFENPWHSSSCELIDTNFIGVRDGKKEKWKKMVKINLSILVFCPTIYLATLKVYKKFEDSGSNTSREIGNRKFNWRERKMDK